DAGAAAGHYVAARAARHAAAAALLAHVRAHIAASTDRDHRTRLRAVERRLRSGRIDLPSLDQDVAPWFEHDRARLQEAHADERHALAALASAYDDDARVIDVAVVDLVSDPRVQEALLWQNPGTLRYARAVLGGPDGGKRRRASELVARVAQRLAVKNDTYSF